ncbi:MAG: sigma-70 family RNA polymerase sigma factor, partial [Ignavibacteria bacterium]
YTIIYYILRDEAEAEDLLQEVFLQIWEKIDSYDETLGNPLAWITRITRNKSIDRLRSKSYKNRSSETDIERFFDLSEGSGSSNPENLSNLNQEQVEITNALKSLNENQRDLIEFAYFRGYSQSELAEHFSIPLGTVKTRMRAAMMTLRNKLKNLI